MLKVYFDNTLIDEDSYTSLSNDYELFTDSFKLGSTASNSFKLSINKKMITNHPDEVKIIDDNTSFYLVIDRIEEDKYTYVYTLTDKLLNFNFKYDASILIGENKANGITTYLSDIWHDMCKKVNVDYDTTYTFINDIKVDWYDSTIQARQYLSYIAELQSGYACILSNGKQTFKKHKQTSTVTIDVDECLDFLLGEKKTITRVVYDNGAGAKWEFGSNTGSTIYLNVNNPFIISEVTVKNIYNEIAGFEFYILEVPNAPANSLVRAGDIITFSDGINNYPTIAQYSRYFYGTWVGGYKLNINTNKQEETKATSNSENIKSLKTELDRANAKLKITSELTNENTGQLAQLSVESNNIKNVVSEQSNSINNLNTNQSNLEKRQTTTELTINGYKIQVETMSVELTKMTYNFQTDALNIAKNTSKINALFNNTGLKVYNYTTLSSIFTDKGTGIDKLIVTGSAQIGYLKIIKAIKNNRKLTQIFTLDNLVENLADLESN